MLHYSLRAAALCWLEQVHATLPEADAAAMVIRSAAIAVEIQALLRNRAADPLREAAKTIGQRAAVQGASLIAVSPHASWDGLIAGVRTVLIIRARGPPVWLAAWHGHDDRPFSQGRMDRGRDGLD